MKMYKRGFYGGKFLPFHKGHRYCIEYAAAQCEELFVILFAESAEEREILVSLPETDYLTPEARAAALQAACATLPNVQFRVLNCREIYGDGKPDWDAETPYVLRTVGDFQAVYSSEPSYGDYFQRAYPFAEHVLIDVPRKHVPISGTAIRNMTREQAQCWLPTEKGL